MAESAGSLVGRVDERSSLRRWLTESASGAPRVVMITGEPGMGKTALMRWLAREARGAGTQVGWGAGIEGIDVPFLAADALLAELPGGPDALAGGESTAGAWGAKGSGRLVGAVQVVRDAAAQHPLVLVLDDLQWTDDASAALIHHLAIVMGSTDKRLPLLLAISAREGHDDGPRSRNTRRLAREPAVRHLHVGPLDQVEVRELHRAVGGRYPTSSELRDLMESTGGRPILVAAHAAHGGLATDFGHGGHDPLDLLGGRIDRLPPSSHAALEVVAVTGARVPHTALPALVGPQYVRELQPAVDSGILRDDIDDIVFEHSLYRQAVLHAMGSDRRERIAREVATQIVVEPLRSRFGAAVVAHHLRAVPGAAPAEIVAETRWEAGEQAYAAGSWGQAADHFEGALAAASEADAIWPDMAERWYRAGEAAFRDIDLRCVDLLRTALATADLDREPDVVAAATVLLVRAVITLGGGPSFARDEEGAAVALAEHPDPRLDRWRASLFGVAAECHTAVYDLEGGAVRAAQARAVAAYSDDPLSGWAVEMSEGLQHMAAVQLDESADCFERAIAITAASGSQWHEASSRFRAGLIDLMRGDLTEVERSASVAMQVARSCHHWSECSFGGGLRTVMHAARGDSRVESEAESAAAMYRRTEYVFSPSVIYPALAYSRAVRGDIGGAADALAQLESLGHGAGAHRQALDRLAYLLTGTREDAHGPPRPAAAQTPLNLAGVPRLAAGAEYVSDLRIDSMLPAFARSIDEALEAGLVITPGWPHFLPRIRAELAVTAGDGDAADRLRCAEDIATRQGLEFELVLIDLLWSRLATDQGEAAERAANAISRADRAGLLTGVAVGQRRLRELGAPSQSPMARVVLNTDIVASTDLTRSLGDEVWLSVLDEHDELVRSSVRRHGGVVFKHTGDGMFAWFVSASEAVLATQSLLAEFESRRLHRGRVSMQIRAGMSLGTPLSRDDGDLFGLTVIEASRLCSAAEAGTGIASAAVADAAGVALHAHGRLDLKGFRDPVDTFRIDPSL